jgi:hypothetical protein
MRLPTLAALASVVPIETADYMKVFTPCVNGRCGSEGFRTTVDGTYWVDANMNEGCRDPDVPSMWSHALHGLGEPERSFLFRRPAQALHQEVSRGSGGLRVDIVHQGRGSLHMVIGSQEREGVQGEEACLYHAFAT